MAEMNFEDALTITEITQKLANLETSYDKIYTQIRDAGGVESMSVVYEAKEKIRKYYSEHLGLVCKQLAKGKV